MPSGEQVCVMVGDRLTVVLPDGEADLGEVSPEDGVLTELRDTPDGPRWIAEKIPAGDPRMAAASRLSAS